MKILAVLAIIMLAIVIVAPISPVDATLPSAMNVIQYRYFANQGALFTALLTPTATGGVDIMDMPLTQAQYATVIGNSAIQVCPTPEADEYELAFNNNWTDGIQMDRRSPMNFTDFRNAMNCLVDKNGVIAGPTLSGFATRDDTQIPQPLMTGYVNPAVSYPNYPWEFNVTRALDILYRGGWYNRAIYPTFASLITAYGGGIGPLSTAGGTANGVVYSGNDPYGQWGGGDPQATANAAFANMPLANLTGYVLSTDARKDLGDIFCMELMAIGCPFVENYRATLAAMRPSVFAAQLYDFATLGYKFTAPPNWFYSELTPVGIYPNGPNCYLVDDANMTQYATDMFNASNQTQYQNASNWVQYILVWESYKVSVWSTVSYNAYKAGMLGMIDELGYSFEGQMHSQLLNWIFMNCKKTNTINYTGPPAGTPASNIIYYGTCNPPEMVNPIFSNSVFDSEVEDEIFSYPLAINPYNTIVPGSAITGNPLGGDLPWMAYSWRTQQVDRPPGYSYGPSGPASWTNVTLWFRNDITWHDGVRFNVSDLAYTIQVMAQYGDSWDHSSAMFLVNTTDPTYPAALTVIDQYTCNISVSSPSWLSLYLCNIPILPKHLYKYIVPNNLTEAELGLSADGLHGLWPGEAANASNFLPVPPGAPGKAPYVTFNNVSSQGSNGVPDYTWIGTGPWKYRIGSTSAASFAPGGGITLDAYPGFFLTIAPGAIAFQYTWLNTAPSAQPKGGYYKVGLVDFVYLAHAYLTTGTPPSTVPINGVPGAPHTWNPAADIAAPSCIIGLTDLVTLALHYGWYYGNYSYNAPYPPSEVANGGPR